MYFDPNLLCYRRKGKFAKCWLAATNPSLFRKYCKRAEIDRICVNDLCADIEKTLQNQQNGAGDPERRFSLIVASQLTYGVVSIYRQQVEILYERSSTLICFQRVVISDFNSAPKKKSYGKNGAKPQLDTTTFTEFITLTEPFDLGPMPVDNGSLTIRESTLAHVEENLPTNDGFGEMSAQEKLAFMDVLEGRRTMADLFDEEVQPEKTSPKRKEVFQCPVKRKRSKRSSPIGVPDALMMSEEVDLTRHAASSWNQTNLTSDQQLGSNVTASVVDTEASITVNQLMNETLDIPRDAPMEIDQLCLSLELPKDPTFDLNNNSIEMPSLNTTAEPAEILEIAPSTSLVVPDISNITPMPPKVKRRSNGRKRKLKVDKKTEIDGLQMRDHIENFLDTLRDYPDYVDLKKRRPTIVYNRPNRECGKELAGLFAKRCKVQADAPDDDTIVDVILGIERLPVDNLQTPVILNAIEESLVLNSTEIQQDVIDLPLMTIEPVNQPTAEVVELPPPVEKLPEPSKKGFQMTHSELRNEWGEQTMMRKLSNYWDRGVEPIDMSVLCGRADRLGAAFAFSTLLCLKKEQMIDLVQQEGDLSIHHIVPGVNFAAPLESAPSA